MPSISTKLKRSGVAKLFYNLPGATSAYHFLWAWSGAVARRNPSRSITTIGITGTKGKTTTLELINAMLEAGGKRTALFSSIREKVDKENGKNLAGNSMPGRAYLQKFLRRAVNAGCEYALIEVTSQGVVLHRHTFIHWDIGALTNLSPEHIEAHGSFENYRNAKLSFLNYVVMHGGKVFLNRDNKHFSFFFDALSQKKNTAPSSAPIAFSKEDIVIKNILPRIRAAREKEGAAAAFILSDFNMENIALAAAIAQQLGIKDDAIEQAILNFKGVPGRMEFVRRGEYTAIADYAHTPDSLEAAYRAAKPKPTDAHPHPKLIAVLGSCGGGRDKWKRAPMGAIAAQWCDEIILTNEDPYDEDPGAILDEIEDGIRKANPAKAASMRRIMDRAEAVRAAVASAREGDVVIGTGKGSEEWIHIANGEKVPWNERAAFEEALKEKLQTAKPKQQ